MNPRRLSAPLLIVLLTGCGGERIFGGGQLELVLSDPSSGVALAWDFEGIDAEQLARAGGEVIPPLYYEGRGGGLVHYQLGSTLWVVGVARAAMRAEADQAFLRVTGPADSACVDAVQTVYFEYHVDLTPWNQARPRTGWMLLKVMDDDVARPHYTSDANVSAVFWDTRSPDLQNQGSFSDVDGYQPASAAQTRLDLNGDAAGSLLATEVPWRQPGEGCWSSFNPDIALHWDMDPEMEKRVRY